MRRILIGGEALSVPHIRRALDLLPRTELINGYGPTETTVYYTGYRIPRPFRSRADVGADRTAARQRVRLHRRSRRTTRARRTSRRAVDRRRHGWARLSARAGAHRGGISAGADRRRDGPRLPHRAIGRAGCRTASWSFLDASITRSRSAASGSSSARSKPCCASTPR